MSALQLHLTCTTDLVVLIGFYQRFLKAKNLLLSMTVSKGRQNQTKPNQTRQSVPKPDSQCPNQTVSVQTRQSVSKPDSQCPHQAVSVHTRQSVSTPGISSVQTRQPGSKPDRQSPNQAVSVQTRQPGSKPDRQSPNQATRVQTRQAESKPGSERSLVMVTITFKTCLICIPHFHTLLSVGQISPLDSGGCHNYNYKVKAYSRLVRTVFKVILQ